MTEQPEVAEKDTSYSYSKNRSRAMSLAGSLLFIDRSLILIDILILAVPYILLHYLHANDLLVIFLMRATEALVLIRVVHRVVAHFQTSTSQSLGDQNASHSVNFTLYLRVLAVSVLYYFIVTAPLIIGAGGALAGHILLLLSLIFLPLGIYLGIRYYYVHFLACFQQCTLSESLRFSIASTRRDWFFPILITLFGIGVLGVISQGIMALAPHGGNQLVNGLAELGIILSKVVVAYLFSAAAILALDSSLMHRLHVLPYIDEKIETLHIQSPSIMRRIFSLTSITPLIFFALIALALNQNRVSSMPPLESMSIVSAEIHGKNVNQLTRIQVTVDSVDSTYLHRTLRPLSFRLANEDDSILLAAYPTSISIDGTPVGAVLRNSLDRNAIRIVLDFDVELSAEGIRQSNDIYLWYKKALIDRIAIAEQ